MRAHLRDLGARREALLAKAAAQRTAAAEATADIRRTLTSVERAAGILRYVGRKPLVVGIALAAAAFLVTRPRQAVTWLGYGFTTYAMFQRIRRLLFSRPAS